MSEQDQSRIRTSDSEREAVVTVLREAMSEGRLTLAEGEERIAAVYAATYRDELPAFTTDLPSPEPPPAGTARPRGQRPPWRRDQRAPRPVAGLITVAAVAAGVWAVLGHALWPAIVLGIMAIMLLKGGGACRYDKSTQDASA
jgi:Domain of unknown function (DUF1707)